MTPPDRARMPTSSVLFGLAAVLLLFAVLGIAATSAAGPPGIEEKFLVVGGKVVPLPDDGKGGQGPGTPTTLPPVPVGPGMVHFAFTSDGPALAPFTGPAAGPWEQVSGTWWQAGGQAALVKSAGAHSLAVVHLAHPPELVEVTLAQGIASAGLVLDYQDPSHFLMVTPVTSSNEVWLTWVDGDATKPVLLLAVHHAVGNGMMIGAQVTATRISVLVNGDNLGTVTYPSADGPRSVVGLVAPGAGTVPFARFDDFIAG